MCLTCGCLFGGKGNKLRFNVHIHAHNGETTINYNPAKTPLTQLTAEFTQRGLTALL